MANIVYKGNLGGTGLDAQHISTNLTAYEAARSNFFTLLVNFEKDLVKATYTDDHENARDNDVYSAERAQEVLKLNVTKAFIPHFELGVLEYDRGNEKIKFAGKPTFSSGGSIEVEDIVGLDTKGILMAWQGLAYNVHTRKGGRMKDYKKNCTLIEYTQDYEPIRAWDLYGCWVSKINDSEFDKSSDGAPRKIGAEIQYDRAVMVELSDTETKSAEGWK